MVIAYFDHEMFLFTLSKEEKDKESAPK